MADTGAAAPHTSDHAGWGLERTMLACPWCNLRRPPDLNPWCLQCGGSLSAEVAGGTGQQRTGLRSLWDFAEDLPVGPRPVTLGEGATPLLPLAQLFPGDEVYAKAEWMNPTGSFKDRGSAVAVSSALALGAEGVVCASTGNNGASVSAYAARAGLPAIVVLPSGTPRAKIVQAIAHGALVAEVEGDFSDAYAMAERIRVETPGWANLTSTFANPYMTAAHATITYELRLQLGGVIGALFAPIGSGPMLDGIMQGAEHLLAAGSLTRAPLPIGVQAVGCAPIARAFGEGADEVTAWEGNPTTIAGSIGDPLRGYAADGTRTLRLVRQWGGVIHAVPDDEIARAMVDLARVEGIACEPTAAAPLGALRALIQARDVPRPIVLIISGHALKDPASQPLARSPDAVVSARGGDVGRIVDQARRYRANLTGAAQGRS